PELARARPCSSERLKTSRLPAHGPRAPARRAAELGSRSGAQTPHGRFPTADPLADAAGQSIDDDAQGLLSAGPRGRRVDDGAGPGVPAGLSDTGDRHCADGTPMAAVGARPPAERDPDAAALGRAA